MSYITRRTRIADSHRSIDVTSPTATNGDGLGRRVSVHLPEGREQIWSSEELAMQRWQAGDTVIFRNQAWRVTGRDEASDALTVTLAPI
jgi:YD repeat-containing protein